MTEFAKDAAAIDITDLLTRYSFDLGGYSVDRLVDTWLNRYPSQWIRVAVIEALYQGRYKAFSVEQILNLWMRRGKCLHRFNHEFERIICGRFPKHSIKYAPHLPSSNPYHTELPRPFQPSAHSQPSSSASTRSFANQQEAAIDRFDDAYSVAANSPELETPEPPAGTSDMAFDVDSESSAKGVPVQPFKPSVDTDLDVLFEFHRSQAEARKQPIHQFIPTSETSDFYTKLKAVAHSTSA